MVELDKEKKEKLKEEEKPEKKNKEKKDSFNINLEEMAQAGVYFGHRSSRVNPKMKPYIWGVRNNIDIIDLNKTAEKLREALRFIQEIAKEGKTMLLVGTKIQTKELVKETAEECGFPYVAERWIGGTFTNLGTIIKRIKYFKGLEEKARTGELEKYTKKEKAKIAEELASLEVKFGGIKNLTQLPDAVFIVNMRKDHLAVKEARMKGIKVIGICDTNTDPSLADYPIPANDDAISSVKYILDKVAEVVKKNQESRTKNQEIKDEKQ